ncbi:unnamed protein product, partial [Rotaria magnacalcarata]
PSSSETSYCSATTKQQTAYDHNRLDPQYKIGDKVLTRIHGNRGKLDPKFSPIPKVHVSDLRPIIIN